MTLPDVETRHDGACGKRRRRGVEGWPSTPQPYPTSCMAMVRSTTAATKETEAVAEIAPDVLMEHIWALADACDRLTGVRLPDELGRLVMHKHRGMQAPSARIFWMDPVLSSMRRSNSAEYRCRCGSWDMGHPGQHVVVTKKMASHSTPRRWAGVDSYVQCGSWACNLPRFSNRCGLASLYGSVVRNSALPPPEGQCIHDKWFNAGMGEPMFLLFADRSQVRALIAKVNGTKRIHIDGCDYNSKADWVRVYYNSLRETPLEDWPRAPTP